MIAVIGRKGGAGKTTTALNLAGALAEQGPAPLLLDLDPQESLARLRVTHEGETSVQALGRAVQRHVTRGDAEAWLGELMAGHALILVDTPPLLGEIMQVALAVADYVVLPTRLIRPDVESLLDTLALCRRCRTLIVPNAVLARNGTHRDMLRELRTTYGALVWEEAIPQSVIIEEALNAGEPVVRYKKRSAPARSYRALAAQVASSAVAAARAAQAVR